DGARLIDEHGKTVASLPAGDWYWPTGSAWLLRADADAAGNPVTVYTDTTGKTRLTLPGTATSFSEGQAAVVLPNGNMRAVNEKGVESGPTFSYIGPRRDGLAAVLVGDRYGYADGQGRLAITPVYLWASAFANQ
ncbi:hypothetical protein LZB78_10005, partial [Campylobacter jejuni]|nr:hypothetical protein [Campylobacter jejuni]